MNQGLVTAAYLGAAVMFILALGGLSHQESARRGNFYGMLGMGIALLVTIVGVVSANHVLLFGALAIGAAVGLLLARRVQMTQMPELVAIMHSLVGLAAVFVGFNADLMINQVVNWSYSSRDVRVKAPVGVSYGSDLDLVCELLMQAVPMFELAFRPDQSAVQAVERFAAEL